MQVVDIVFVQLLLKVAFWRPEKQRKNSPKFGQKWNPQIWRQCVCLYVCVLVNLGVWQFVCVLVCFSVCVFVCLSLLTGADDFPKPSVDVC